MARTSRVSSAYDLPKTVAAPRSENPQFEPALGTLAHATHGFGILTLQYLSVGMSDTETCSQVRP